MIKWTKSEADRWIILHAKGQKGDTHVGDILVSRTLEYHLYIKGAIKRTIEFDDGSTRIDNHTAPSDTWKLPDNPHNIHFMSTREFMEDGTEYLCIKQLEMDKQYEFTTGIYQSGENLDTSQSKDIIVGSGIVRINDQEAQGPLIIEDAHSKSLSVITEAHILFIGGI